jgi:hypothetical protein
VFSTHQKLPTARDHDLVATYSPYDPLELPRRLFDALGYFDGRPTQDALRRIRDECCLRLQPALVRRLVDFGVLVPADGPAGA